MSSDKANNAKILGRIVPTMPEPIGLYKIPTEDHNNFKEKILDIDQNAAEEFRRNDSVQKQTLRHISNNRKQNIFRDFPELKPLELILKSYAVNYFWETGFDCTEVLITDAWINIGSKNSVLQAHLHANSYLSGNYFVNFNPQVHTTLNFYNDRLMNGTERKPFLSVKPRTQKTIYNIRDIALAAVEGDVIFWRSHLLHGFNEPNKADQRITLSFNIMPKICHTGDQYSFVVSEEL